MMRVNGVSTTIEYANMGFTFCEMAICYPDIFESGKKFLPCHRIKDKELEEKNIISRKWKIKTQKK